MNRLQIHAVADDTALRHYLVRVEEFLKWIETRRFSFKDKASVGLALADFLEFLCYQERRGIAAGRDAVHGFAHLFPDYGPFLSEAYRALQAWGRLGLQGEGRPVCFETVALVSDWCRSVQEFEMADMLEACVDGWLRFQDLEHLLAEDLIVSQFQGQTQVAAVLGARERGESTKTGPLQGVTFEFPKIVHMLMTRKRNRRPSAKVFNISKPRAAALWEQGLRRLGHPTMPFHSLRHAGPSRDAFLSYRRLDEIKKRGRWRSKEALARYSKPHMYVQALSLLSPAQLNQGAALVMSWGERPDIPRQ